MARIVVQYTLIIILSFSLTACWDQQEVDNLAIVIGLGIDKIPNSQSIMVTAQVANPSSKQTQTGGVQGKPFIVLNASGTNVYDAVRNFAKKSPRRMFLSHNNVVIFGESLSKSGIRDVLDYFEREPYFRRTSWVVTSAKSASELLEVEIDLQQYPAIGIKNMIKHFQHDSLVKAEQWKDLITSLENKSASAVLTNLNVITEKSRENGQEKKVIRLEGTSLLHKDKLVGYFNDKENEGLLWILNELRGGEVTTRCAHEKKGEIVFQVTQTGAKLTPTFGSDRLRMFVDIQAEATLAEINCENMDISDQDALVQLQKQQEKVIQETVMAAVQKAQQLKTDVFHFNDAFRSADVHQWKKYCEEWDEHFSKMGVSVHVSSKIRLTGTKNQPVNVQD